MCSIFAVITFHSKMQMKVDISEEELSLQCQRGDMQARRTLYERYGGGLMAICLRYIGDRETAEDVLHDGFLRIFQSIKQFSYQGEGSLKAWLSRVMVNEALGYLRKKNVQLQQEVLMTEIPDVPDTDDSDLNDIPRSVLMKFISELPDGYRTVFNLYVFEEKSHKEIASLLGITEHTSSSQFYRAKSLLIKKINEYRKRELR
jgi:RNA polymerase sigma-70 factor (ECF subfamily)